MLIARAYIEMILSSNPGGSPSLISNVTDAVVEEVKESAAGGVISIVYWTP